MIGAMSSGDARSLTAREFAVLRAMLDVQTAGIEELRAQAHVVTARDFPDGRPSIYLDVPGRPGGMAHLSNAEVVDRPGDGIALWTASGRLYALEWFGREDVGPAEFPEPSRLRVVLAE